MAMKLVCEYNNSGVLMQFADLPGAYLRRRTGAVALKKTQKEIADYTAWDVIVHLYDDIPVVRRVGGRTEQLILFCGNSVTGYKTEAPEQAKMHNRPVMIQE